MSKKGFPDFNSEPAEVTRVVLHPKNGGKPYFFADVFEPDRKPVRVMMPGKNQKFINSLERGDGIRIKYSLQPESRRAGVDGKPDMIFAFGLARSPEFDHHHLLTRGDDGKAHYKVLRGRVLRKGKPFRMKLPEYPGISGYQEKQNLVLSVESDIPGVYQERKVMVPKRIADTVSEKDILEMKPYVRREIKFHCDDEGKPVIIGKSDTGKDLYQYELDENGFAKTRIVGLELNTDDRKYFRNLSKGQFPFPSQDTSFKDVRKDVQKDMNRTSDQKNR